MIFFPRLKKLLPRAGDVIFIATFVTVIFSGERLLNSDGDLGRHLAVGQYILDTHNIPTHDIFSFTMAGQTITPHEWLSEVIFAVSYRLLGLDGVVLLCALILALTMGLVYQQAWKRSGLVLPSIAITFYAVLASSIHWIARPHLWTMLFVVIWAGGLERLRRGQYALWWVLPLLMCLWANLHGAFIAGFAIWLMYIAGVFCEQHFFPEKNSAAPANGKIWLGVGGLSFLASFVNPAGGNIWTTSLGYITNHYLVDHTVEYLSPDFHDPNLWTFAFFILLTVFLLGMRWLQLRPAPLFLLLGWTAMGMYSVRNIPLYALIAAPILAEGSADFFRSHMTIRDPGGGGFFSLASTVLIVGLIVGGERLGFTFPENRFDPQIFPVEAARWIEANPPAGNMYNYFMWGGYFLYRLWPEQKVFIDGQTDFYGEDLTRQYISVSRGDAGWQDILAQHQVSWAIVPANSLVARLLQNELNWKIAYQDGTAVVLEKQ